MIDKTAASSRVAGYLQSRQGRRPVRVDTLLAKLEKESKRGSFPKQASLVPPLVTQLALGILEKTAEKTWGENFSTGVREIAPELGGTAAGAAVGGYLAGKTRKRLIPRIADEVAEMIQQGATPRQVNRFAGRMKYAPLVGGGLLGAAVGAGLGHGARRLYMHHKDES